MKQTDPQFKLRIPKELKDRLDEIAAINRRSTTAEIIARLEKSFKRPADLKERRLKGVSSVLEEDGVVPTESSEEAIIEAVKEAFKRMRAEHAALEQLEEEAGDDDLEEPQDKRA